MPPEAKQQHYIPVTYSKNFGDQRGLLTICDLRDNSKIFKTQPKNVFKEKHLYTQPVHAESRFDNAMERYFSQEVELHWNGIIRKISDKQIIDQSDWEKFIFFMLSLRVRVPNTLNSAQKLLRDSVRRVSDLIEAPIPDIFLDIYERETGKPRSEAKFSELVEAEIIKINIDPHRALTSMPYIVQSTHSFMGRIGIPNFIHNRTSDPFISSDNPVCYFIAGTSIDEIEPYGLSPNVPSELIFPLTSQIALCVDSRRSDLPMHRNVYSGNTVKRVNEVVSLFSERYIFGEAPNIKNLADKFKNVSPVPDANRSTVENGFVYQIAYSRGEPEAFENNWEYSFKRE